MYREMLDRLCRRGLYRACRFSYIGSERFAKYILTLFETYQLLGPLVLECIDDELCASRFVDMVMRVVEAEPYDFVIDPSRVKYVLRRIEYLRSAAEQS